MNTTFLFVCACTVCVCALCACLSFRNKCQLLTQFANVHVYFNNGDKFVNGFSGEYTQDDARMSNWRFGSWLLGKVAKFNLTLHKWWWIFNIGACEPQHKTCLNLNKKKLACVFFSFSLKKIMSFVNAGSILFHSFLSQVCVWVSAKIFQSGAMPCRFIIHESYNTNSSSSSGGSGKNYLMRQIRSSLSRSLMLSWQFYSVDLMLPSYQFSAVFKYINSMSWGCRRRWRRA